MRVRIFSIGLVACAGWTSAAMAQQADVTTSTTTSPPTPVTTAPPADGTPTETTAAIMPTGEQQASLDLPAPEKTTSPINRPLMVTGLILLGGTYGASAIAGATSNRDADKNNLFYPVVGPWMDYGDRGCDARPCSNETGNKTLLILDGVGQGLGAIGIVTSLFIPEKTTRNWYLIGDSGVRAAPMRVGTGYGLGAAGTF